MKIKICGLKHPENIKAVAGLAPDYMGFIFYKGTPRFVEDLPPGALGLLHPSINKTAVFVNEDAATVNAVIDKYGFNTIQLHGTESPEFADSFRNRVTVIKAFGVSADFDFEQLSEYADKVDYFLFDTKTAIHGGSGLSFDWSILNNYKLDIPFFLSGGLSLDNLHEVQNIGHPQFYGVDLNSRFEISPGLKDLKKLKKAIDIIKINNTHEIRS